MARILISLLSDYLQPNFLLIKEFAGKYDKLAFIRTKRMEEEKKKSFWLENALKLPENSVRRITVVEDDFEGIMAELQRQNFSKSDEYILNLTGGTKVMPLAVYEFFKNDFYAQFYYVPIEKNVIKGLSTQSEQPLNYRMNLDEYFTLQGLRYECDNTLLYTKEHTENLFERFRKAKFNRNRIDEIKNSQTLPTSKERKYYGGVWFEEYCYNRLKKEQNLPNEAICKSAKIFRDNSKQNDNEIDIMFVKDNKLYVFECKVGMKGFANAKEPTDISLYEFVARETIEKYQYKLAAIAKDFGLRVEAYILTLHKIFNNPTEFSEQTIENIKKRQKILGLKEIIDSIHFTHSEPLLVGVTHKMPDVIAAPKAEKQQPHGKTMGIKIVGKIDLSKINYNKKRK